MQQIIIFPKQTLAGWCNESFVLSGRHCIVKFFTTGTKQKQVHGGRAVVEYHTGRQRY